MIKSQPILPIRFYDNLYNQDRFNKFHDRRFDTPLCYPASALPSFQFIAPSSTTFPDAFALKKVCDEDNYYKLLSEGVSNFEPIATENYLGGFGNAYEDQYGRIKGLGGYYDNGVDPPVGVNHLPIMTFNCGKMKGGDMTYYTYIPGPNPGSPPPWSEMQVTGLLPSNKHNFKLIVERFSAASTFAIKIYNGLQGGTLLATITKAGIYSYDFIAVTNKLTVVFENYASAGDSYEFSYWQVTKHFLSGGAGNDIALDELTLQMFELESGEHLIAFCDPLQDYTVPPGDYYYVVRSGTDYYCSEVFTIKSLRELESYYLLTWYNECDLERILYNTTSLPCEFRNKLYLDAALFKPEYDTAVENITNGDNTNLPVFKKWQKYRTLEIMKTPEFLVDALSGIFLHDHVYLQEPIQREQVNRDTAFFVEEVTPDISPILFDA
jgi:hypothetical protein